MSYFKNKKGRKFLAHDLSHGDTLLNCAYNCFRIANNATTHILSSFTLGRTCNFAANQQASLISYYSSTIEEKSIARSQLLNRLLDRQMYDPRFRPGFGGKESFRLFSCIMYFL